MRHLKWILTTLATNADLNEPQKVIEYVERRTQSNNYRNTFLGAYKQFLRFLGIDVKIKKYAGDSKEIKCPTKEKLQMLIADSGKLMSLKLQISMETGLRPVELFTLRVKDIDTDQRLVYPKTAKHGAPRKLQISHSLNARVQAFIIKNDKDQNELLFKGDEVRYGREFRELRNRLAKNSVTPH